MSKIPVRLMTDTNGGFMSVIPGRRLQPFFTAACIHVREQAGVSTARIADLAGLKVSVSVDRFEAGDTFPSSNLERYAAAYAYDAGMDPRDLILMAVDWWKQHGECPMTVQQERREGLEEGEPQQPTPRAVLQSIRRAESAQALKDRERAAEQPTATRRRRKEAG